MLSPTGRRAVRRALGPVHGEWTAQFGRAAVIDLHARAPPGTGIPARWRLGVSGHRHEHASDAAHGAQYGSSTDLRSAARLMGYQASTILTMLLNELLHSLRTRTGDGMCRGVLTATASSWVRPCASCGDSRSSRSGRSPGPGATREAGVAGSCQIRARSGAGQRLPTRVDEHDRTRIGPAQTRSVRVAGLGRVPVEDWYREGAEAADAGSLRGERPAERLHGGGPAGSTLNEPGLRVSGN